MLKTLQKHAPTISILLLIALVIALFFSPPFARLLSSIIIVFGISTAILFTIHRNWVLRQDFDKPNLTSQEHPKEGGLTNAEFVRNTIIDLLGLALIMGSAVWLGRLTGTYVGLAWGNLLGIVVAMAVGFIAAFLVGKGWGKIAEPMRASS